MSGGNLSVCSSTCVLHSRTTDSCSQINMKFGSQRVFKWNPSPGSHIYLLFLCVLAVPLRTPELSLTSQSSTDIQITWQPLPAKLSRGRLSAYRLSYRTAADSAVTSVEIPQNSTEYLLENLQPDTIYLLRMAAATRVGWCEPSAWTSHRTPKISSSKGKQRISPAKRMLR